MRNRFLQYLSSENKIGSPKRRKFDTEIDQEITWGQAQEKRFLTNVEPRKLTKTSPEITPASKNTCSCESCCSQSPPRWW